jgi:hypothetical protein
MTEKVPLEAMLRRASRVAENMFERDGKVTAFWLADTAGGRQQTILTSRRRCPWPKLVIDLGLRLADIAGLEREPAAATQTRKNR